MWARAAIRSSRGQIQRPLRLTRRYNGSHQTGPPKTYFEQPPPNKTYFQTPPSPASQRSPRSGWVRLGVTSLAVFTGCGVIFFLGAIAGADLVNRALKGRTIDVADLGVTDPNDLSPAVDVMRSGQASLHARRVPPLGPKDATELLALQAWTGSALKSVAHGAQQPSNLPCEDTWTSTTWGPTDGKTPSWCQWGLFDGHAGPRTSHMLEEVLHRVVADRLIDGGFMRQASYIPNDPRVLNTIRKAFVEVDKMVLEEAKRVLEADFSTRSEVVSFISNCMSGSCALMAIYDPVHGVLRVANTGDSRAVLGRWDGKSYRPMPMSTDHTGFNQSEVERLKKSHPDEDVVDPETGRVFGLAVTRAFGDARWKWPESLTRLAHEKFWGPPPRPNGVIRTPPYLTAEPEIVETRIQTGDHPDFLILATDGLWDLMSNEDAVKCVSMWLQQYSPLTVIENQRQREKDEAAKGVIRRGRFAGPDKEDQENSMPMLFRRADEVAATPEPEDEETHYDPSERTMKWKVSPKHFVVEDDHAGVHLIKNALGGNRKELFSAVMSIQPPLSRNVRDDITVQVIFFGYEDTESTEALATSIKKGRTERT